MGRHLASSAARLAPRLRGCTTVAIALATFVLLPGVAAAHPLGNFTINHYAEVRVEPERVLLDVVIDQAEIAAFQSRQAFDADRDGSVSDAEIAAGRITACDELAPDLRLTADDVRLDLRTIEAGLSFPPGIGGLSTMRLVCAFEAPLAAPVGAEPTRVAYSDESYPDRLGWREIVVRGSGVSLHAVHGEARATSISARLTVYPDELVARPLADRTVVIDAIAGAAELEPFDLPDAEPIGGVVSAPSASAIPSSPPAAPSASTAPVGSAPSAPPTPGIGSVPGGVDGDALPGIFREVDLTPLVLMVSLLTAAALGAGHALTPGHGKTLMAAYLVGTRGTPLHAVGLGLSVSLSHTLGVLVLAGLVVGALDVLPPELVVRWAPVVAAVSIVAIGVWMLVGELRRRRNARTPPLAPGDHDHDHGGLTHPHAAAPGSTITWRSLFGLGLAGGLIPSTSALLILLGSIAAGRPVFGFVLVVAFGLGMAAVMGGIGLALVAARGRLDRLPADRGLGRLRATVPLAAAMIVLGFGLYLTAQAVFGSPAF